MGMFFDHGLDCTTAVVVMYPLGRVHQVGSGFMLLFFLLSSTVSFYYLTLQEYYLGKLTLPVLSGPDDTSVGISAVCFITAYYGSDMWMQEYDFFGFGKRRLSNVVIFILVSQQVAGSLFFVASNLYQSRHTEFF